MAAETDTRTDTSAGATLGLERWVQFAFIALAVTVFWLLDNIVGAVWNIFAEPDPTLVSASALGVAAVGAIILYRMPSVHGWAHEVAAELSKVTWPTRKETWSATIVVLVVSVIAAVILGVMDTAWAWVTDLIYTA